jgi:hypothetical protein
VQRAEVLKPALPHQEWAARNAFQNHIKDVSILHRMEFLELRIFEKRSLSMTGEVPSRLPAFRQPTQ